MGTNYKRSMEYPIINIKLEITEGTYLGKQVDLLEFINSVPYKNLISPSRPKEG